MHWKDFSDSQRTERLRRFPRSLNTKCDLPPFIAALSLSKVRCKEGDLYTSSLASLVSSPVPASVDIQVRDHWTIDSFHDYLPIAESQFKDYAGHSTKLAPTDWS